MAEPAETCTTSLREILRSARELYGWSLEEVAAELNLPPQVVEALEADDYSQIAGWTYAVGIFAHHARLAGVSIERAIDDRQELLPAKEDGPGTMTESATSRPQPIPIQYRWVVTAVSCCWWLGTLPCVLLNRASDVEFTFGYCRRNTLAVGSGIRGRPCGSHGGKCCPTNQNPNWR